MLPRTAPLPARTHLPLLHDNGAQPGNELAATDFTARSIDVYLTSTCNRKCTYCFLSDSFFASKLNISLQTVRDILTWTSGSSIEEVTLLGGEPALHPDFGTIVTLIHQAGLQARVVTNGSARFRKSLLDTNVAAGLARVAVSLDAPVPEVFDRLRGRGAFRDAMLTVDLLKSQQKPFDINFTVVKSALPYVRQMLEFTEELGARRLNIHWFSEVGRAVGAHETVQPGQWKKVLEEVVRFASERTDFIVDCELGFGHGFAGEDRHMCAVRERSNLQFMPDGTVFSCGMLVDRPDLAGYVWRDGGLYLRQAESEVTRTALPCDGCPMRVLARTMNGSPVPLCIYNRLDRPEISSR